MLSCQASWTKHTCHCAYTSTKPALSPLSARCKLAAHPCQTAGPQRVRSTASQSRGSSQICRAGKVSEGWWKQYTELWEDVGSEQEFEALLNEQSDKLLVVDFWGKTCKGCEAVYLQLCRVADDQGLRKKVKFVKVCVDGMVDRTKAEGVRALPYVAFYRGKQGKLGGSTTNPTQAKHFRKNIQTVLENPGKIFNQDPNGFWVARDPPTKEATELKAQQLAKMQEQTKQMRKHLLGEYFGDVKR